VTGIPDREEPKQLPVSWGHSTSSDLLRPVYRLHPARVLLVLHTTQLQVSPCTQCNVSNLLTHILQSTTHQGFQVSLHANRLMKL